MINKAKIQIMVNSNTDQQKIDHKIYINVFIIGSTQFNTRLNQEKDAQHKQKKLSHNLKNQCKAEENREMLNQLNLIN